MGLLPCSRDATTKSDSLLSLSAHDTQDAHHMSNKNEELCPQNFRDANEVLNNTTDLLLLIIAIFLPPITVLLKRGVDIHLLINILLWIFLFWIGGVLHAWYIVFVTEGSLLDKK